MQDYNARGIIHRIFTKSPGVFIFVFKTIEKHPLMLKAKKFKPNDMDEQTFLAMCDVFAEEQTVFIRNSRITTEKVFKNEQVVLTTDGQPVYAPIINVDFMSVEAAFIHHAPKIASTPDLPEPALAQAHASVQRAPQRQVLTPVPTPAPAPQPAVQPAEANDDSIPFIPFD